MPRELLPALRDACALVLFVAFLFVVAFILTKGA